MRRVERVHRKAGSAARRAGPAWHALNRRIVQCSLCPRLRDYCRSVAASKRAAYRDWTYWGKPVPNFGDPRARLLIVGLAPAAHGANRTGRMFTGDRSGDWLYGALYRFGFANQATSQSRSDGLELLDCAITASCHCAPPGNKPTPAELAACSRWLDGTLNLVPARVIIVLGQVAWRSVIDLARRRHWLSGPSGKFSHGAVKRFADGRWLIASYHPSQQNTFTGRLTQPMFDGIFATARSLLSQAGRHA